MRKSKERKHDKVANKQRLKVYLKNNRLTSNSTMNRRKRVTMDTESIPYVIVNGVIYTYVTLIL